MLRRRREGFVFARLEMDAAVVIGIVAGEDGAGGFGEET